MSRLFGARRVAAHSCVAGRRAADILRLLRPTLAAALLAATMLPTVAAAQPRQPSAGADSTHHDTIRVVHAHTVNVEASSILPRIARSAQPLAAVTRRDIVAANAVDLADALAYVPGVFVKQYGGMGGLRTLSLRGASSQQTVLLLDGIRYRGNSADAFDLGNLPADAIERIEVVRGGNAALYGANALGGVVNVVTRMPAAGDAGLRLNVAAGSFAERRVGVDAHTASDRDAWSGTFCFSSAGGDYPFSFNEFGTTSELRRDNADITNLFGRAAWRRRFDDGARVGVTVQGFSSERGVPGAVVQGSREQAQARLDEREIFAVARYDDQVGPWLIAGNISGRLNALHYRDPEAIVAAAGGLDDHYDARDLMLTARARRILGTTTIVDAGVDAAWTTLDGDNLDPGAGRSVRRLSVSGSAGVNWLWEEGLFDCETALDVGMRADILSDFAPAVSPSVGFVWRAGTLPLRLRVHGALGFRAPSFTEQYYLNYGNHDLQPEHGASLDAGATVELGDGFVLESSAFVMDTRDAIIAVPRSVVSWSAMNAARTSTRGIELAAAGELFDRALGLRASYTRMRAEDRSGGITQGRLLPYAPEELFTGLVDLRWNAFGCGVNWQYASHRFALAANDYPSMLPRYTVVGASASAHQTLGGVDLELRAEFANLFDVAYQVVRNYPMPGRSVRFELVGRIQ